MPQFDEDGNIIGIDEFPIALRGDDSVEWIIPWSPPPDVLSLTGKGCEKLLRVVKDIRSERVMLLKKCSRLIRRDHRMRENIRRERLKGASMDRLWDIELRRRSLAGELTKIYRRFGTWE